MHSHTKLLQASSMGRYMSITAHLATTVAGAARFTLRSVLHRSGGALPGYLAMKIDPNLLASLANSLDASVVVTGTNGKTTTTNLIADAITQSGALTACNRAGNNMETGLVAALLENSSALKRAKAAGTRRIGVFECDELYTVRVLPKLKPTYFVLLNLFRDQLDRYGEIDHTQDAIARALESSPTTTFIFNADDPLCAAIAARVSNPSLPFGLEGATNTETTRVSDSRFCPQCNAALDYEYVQYGQLGKYHCPKCGWVRPALAHTTSKVELSNTGYSFDLAGRPGTPTLAHIQTRYNGLYMVYNVSAAFAAATELGAQPQDFQGVLDAYTPTGGRMTSWDIAGRPVVTNLAKNPVGFDRMIQQVKTAEGKLVAFYLNDAEADGRDVSWLWDVDFERLASTPGLTVFVGGSRANDLQVRLKYAGIDTVMVDGISPVLGAVAQKDLTETLFVIANYTAFPPIVKELEGMVQTTASALASQACALPQAELWNVSTPERTLDRPLRISHLFPDALNLYGDGGNAMILQQRCMWRGIPVEVQNINLGDEVDLSQTDIVLMGGGSDRDQFAVEQALLAQRKAVSEYVECGGVMLAICGSYQLMGRSYYMGDAQIEGLGIMAMDTHRGDSRQTGNAAVESKLFEHPLVGFENHGGRTKLDDSETALGESLVAGLGNNSTDGSEGCVHNNLIGTYLHGPALSKNPELADWLITCALKQRVAAGDTQAAALLPLSRLDDAYEFAAHAAAMKILG